MIFSQKFLKSLPFFTEHPNDIFIMVIGHIGTMLGIFIIRVDFFIDYEGRVCISTERTGCWRHKSCTLNPKP